MAGEQGDWMLIGRILGPFGIRGEMKVGLYTDSPDRFKELDRVFLGPDHRLVKIERSRRHKGQVLLKVEGIETPEQVENVKNNDVTIPRSEAITLPTGHYYLDDVVGLEVVTVDGVGLGRITDVLQTPSNDVYVVNEGRNAILVPGTREAVQELNVDKGLMVVQRWVIEPE